MFIIIPAKPFPEAKTRLAPALSLQERAALSEGLLRRTIEIAGAVGQVVVVSRSAVVWQVAQEAGAWALVEHTPDLNAAIRQGVQWAGRRGAEVVLILPADLPLLSVRDLVELTSLGRQERPCVVIAPCRRGRGTNALLLRPPDVIAPHFGAASFAVHQAAAHAAGVAPRIYRAAGLAFDLDTPGDWARCLSSTLKIRRLTH
jgi:2-phospho-L-lactate guanylyltransferase